jgi:hypothetical protein
MVGPPEVRKNAGGEESLGVCIKKLWEKARSKNRHPKGSGAFP